MKHFVASHDADTLAVVNVPQSHSAVCRTGSHIVGIGMKFDALK